VRVFLEISHRPLMTVAGAHFMNEALAACGAANVFSGLAEVAPQVSWEELYARNPQAIVGTGPEGGEEAFRRDWAERASLEAVRRGKVAYVASRALGRPSPRVVEGIEALCAAVDRLR
jgi:ABC-type Fe3+-hydroxamate transport system substrate-binding protein